MLREGGDDPSTIARVGSNRDRRGRPIRREGERGGRESRSRGIDVTGSFGFRPDQYSQAALAGIVLPELEQRDSNKGDVEQRGRDESDAQKAGALVHRTV